MILFFRLDSEDDLEEISCTDREQQWGRIKAGVKKDFEPIPISEYESVDKYTPPVYSRGTPSVDSDLAAEFAKKIAAGELSYSNGFGMIDIRSINIYSVSCFL